MSANSPRSNKSNKRPQQYSKAKDWKFQLEFLKKFGLPQLATIAWLFTDVTLAVAFRRLLIDARKRCKEALLQYQADIALGWYVAEVKQLVMRLDTLVEIAESILKETYSITSPVSIDQAVAENGTKLEEAKAKLDAMRLGWVISTPKSYEERRVERMKEERRRTIKFMIKHLRTTMTIMEFDGLVDQLMAVSPEKFERELRRRAFEAKRQSIRENNPERAHQLTWLAYRLGNIVGLTPNDMREVIEAERQAIAMAAAAKDAKLAPYVSKGTKADEVERQAARAKKNGNKQREGKKK